MNRKTWIYIGAAAAIMVVAYLLFRPSTTYAGTAYSAPGTTAGTIDATGRAATGLASLWRAIFGGDSSSAEGSLSTNYSGSYYLDGGE